MNSCREYKLLPNPRRRRISKANSPLEETELKSYKHSRQHLRSQNTCKTCYINFITTYSHNSLDV